jgi:hypothetical protein
MKKNKILCSKDARVRSKNSIAKEKTFYQKTLLWVLSSRGVRKFIDKKIEELKREILKDAKFGAYESEIYFSEYAFQTPRLTEKEDDVLPRERILKEVIKAITSPFKKAGYKIKIPPAEFHAGCGPDDYSFESSPSWEEIKIIVSWKKPTKK